MAEIAKQLEKLMDCSILIYPAEGEQLTEALFYPCADETRPPEFYTGDDERAVAQWVLRNNKHAGRDHRHPARRQVPVYGGARP